MSEFDDPDVRFWDAVNRYADAAVAGSCIGRAVGEAELEIIRREERAQVRRETVEALVAEWEEAYSTSIFPEIDLRDVPQELRYIGERSAAAIMRHWAQVLRRRTEESEASDE